MTTHVHEQAFSGVTLIQPREQFNLRRLKRGVSECKHDAREQALHHRLINVSGRIPDGWVIEGCRKVIKVCIIAAMRSLVCLVSCVEAGREEKGRSSMRA